MHEVTYNRAITLHPASHASDNVGSVTGSHFTVEGKEVSRTLEVLLL